VRRVGEINLLFLACGIVLGIGALLLMGLLLVYGLLRAGIKGFG